MTKQWLYKHRTKNGGWTKKQLEVIGVCWPPIKGWKKRAIGREITSEQVEAFEKGKHIRAPYRQRQLTARQLVDLYEVQIAGGESGFDARQLLNKSYREARLPAADIGNAIALITDYKNFKRTLAKDKNQITQKIKYGGRGR